MKGVNVQSFKNKLCFEAYKKAQQTPTRPHSSSHFSIRDNRGEHFHLLKQLILVFVCIF